MNIFIFLEREREGGSEGGRRGERGERKRTNITDILLATLLEIRDRVKKRKKRREKLFLVCVYDNCLFTYFTRDIFHVSNAIILSILM